MECRRLQEITGDYTNQFLKGTTLWATETLLGAAHSEPTRALAAELLLHIQAGDEVQKILVMITPKWQPQAVDHWVSCRPL